jgi:hypothetical protein
LSAYPTVFNPFTPQRVFKRGETPLLKNNSPFP